MNALRRPATHSRVKASVSTSDPRAVLISHAPSCMPRQAVGVDQVTCRGQLRRVDRDDVGPPEELVELHARHPEPLGVSDIEVRVGDRDDDVECRESLDHQPADGRRADQTDPQAARPELACGTDAGHRREPPRLPQRVAHAEHVLGDHHDGREGELRHRHRVGGRGTRDDDPSVPRPGRDGVLDRARGVGEESQLRHPGQQRVVEHVASPAAEDDLDARELLVGESSQIDD